ncbi:vasoactive intestinal polypeptide receptor-like isoform X1 [Asterias amurensis]|uniref:vasoactive intestinal polypeptide receptor-like isoform X1 n=1 Tax=Asterias amurensis TaxID=7602 RepID=UPI003AB7F073
MKLSVWVLFATALQNHVLCQTYAGDVIDDVTTIELIVEYNATGSSDYEDLNGSAVDEECGVCEARKPWACHQDGDAVYVTSEEDILGQTLRVIVYIGFSISLVACIVANIIYVITRRNLKHSPYHIHWNLIASFTMYHVVFLIDVTVLPTCYVTNVHVRNLLNVLLAYTVLANFFWMLVEGLILFFIVVKSFFDRQEGKDFIKWCLIGWGTPALLVIIWIVIEEVTSAGSCVVQLQVSKTNGSGIGCLVAPVFVILLVNGVVLVVVIRNISLKLRANHSNRLESRSHRRTAKSTFVLLVLLGTYYSLPIIVAFIGQPCLFVKIVNFIATTISSVQGLAVSTLYVFCNGEVRDQIKRVLSRRYSEWGPVTMVTGTTPMSSQTSSKRNSSSSGSEGSKHHRLHQQTTTNLEMKVRIPAEDINSNAADVLLAEDPNTATKDNFP